MWSFSLGIEWHPFWPGGKSFRWKRQVFLREKLDVQRVLLSYSLTLSLCPSLVFLSIYPRVSPRSRILSVCVLLSWFSNTLARLNCGRKMLVSALSTMDQLVFSLWYNLWSFSAISAEWGQRAREHCKLFQIRARYVHIILAGATRRILNRQPYLSLSTLLNAARWALAARKLHPHYFEVIRGNTFTNYRQAREITGSATRHE